MGELKQWQDAYNTGLARPYERTAAHTDADVKILALVWFTGALGILASLRQNSTLLTAFILVVFITYMDGLSPPAVLLALRYPIDGVLVYMAFLLRRKLMCS